MFEPADGNIRSYLNEIQKSISYDSFKSSLKIRIYLNFLDISCESSMLEIRYVWKTVFSRLITWHDGVVESSNALKTNG